MDLPFTIFSMNLPSNTLRIGVNSAGKIAFNYGNCPSTCYFDQNGVYELTFSDSWNLLKTVNRCGDLPSDLAYFGILSAHPQYSSVGTNATCVGTNCTFSCYWIDDWGLSTAIFSTNITGVWQNETLQGFSGKASWANATKLLQNETCVSFRWYANNTRNHWSCTPIQTLNVAFDQGSAIGFGSSSGVGGDVHPMTCFSLVPIADLIGTMSFFWSRMFSCSVNMGNMP